MLKKVFFFVLLIIGIASCDNTVQYSVVVKNSTNSDLKIEYRTMNDERGEVEEIIDLKKGEMKFIINTVDLSIEGSNGTSAAHHNYVAEYIRAYNDENEPSKLNWYDEKIKFEKTDLGQAEFTIEYTNGDF